MQYETTIADAERTAAEAAAAARERERELTESEEVVRGLEFRVHHGEQEVMRLRALVDAMGELHPGGWVCVWGCVM